MNLETRLPDSLWEAVRSNYEKRNFTGAVLDAFYFLSELLRNKSGIEGDGQSLIGQALGGAAPKIKLNRLRTESEQNIQKGMEQVLRGLYQGIRNPRSHDKIADKEEDAQALLIFLGYLVKQIDQAKAQFSRSDFVRRVLDPDFVPQERYSELLIADIPPRARLDVFLDLYQEIEHWKPEHMSIFLKVLFAHLDENEIRQVCEVLTEDLKVSEDEATLRAVLASFPPELWPRIGEVSRIRSENKLIRAIREGRFDKNSNRCRGGALGTWSTVIFSVMTLKAETIDVIARKLCAGSIEERRYVLKYLFSQMRELSETIPKNIVTALCSRLKAGDAEIYAELEFAPPWLEDTWPKDLKAAYVNFSEAVPTIDFDEDIPF